MGMGMVCFCLFVASRGSDEEFWGIAIDEDPKSGGEEIAANGTADESTQVESYEHT